MNKNEISNYEKVCANCKHLAWLIGIGAGLRCSHPKKYKEGEVIPNQRHTCEMFQAKEIRITKNKLQ